MEQHFFQQLCPELKFWGHPCFGPTPSCLWPWAWPRWSCMSRKILDQPSFLCWTTFASTTLPRNEALGASLLLAYSWLSMALGLAQMVLDVRKNLKPTQFYMLNNLCFNNFSKKSIPGDVRAQVLQGPVLLAPPTLIRAGNPGCTNHFWTLGVKPDPTVPHIRVIELE